MPALIPVMEFIGYTSLAVAAVYALLTLIAMLVWRTTATTGSARGLPSVTVLKPLCGAEPGLYEHLRSFCARIIRSSRSSSACAIRLIRRWR
jgi:ceramide glucosyltransferase